MSDCDRVRHHSRMTVECCVRCHQAQELTTFILRGVGEVDVCCAIAAMVHPLDKESPTRPYGLEDRPSEKEPVVRRPV